jgi:putative two-component system response regulator
MLDGYRAVSAARASARTARTVANVAGPAGAILQLLMLVAATRRTTAERMREVTAASSALEALGMPARANAYADSRQHDDRVGRIAAEIAAAMGHPAVFQDLLRQAAPLHDVGNVAVPDHILLKPGALTSDERAVMEQHTTTGAEILADGGSAVLKMAQTISREHHERWDGLGYPRGLSGTEIGLSARIVAVADVFDALTHVRPHRQGSTIKEAVAYIVEERGAHFDPSVVDAFLEIDHRAIDAPAEEAPRPQTVALDEQAVATAG